jgi:predicted RecB family nuclease
MKKLHGEIRLSATDVSNHLACRHLTQLEIGVTREAWERPKPRSAELLTIQELGLRHEGRYVESLKQQGLEIQDFQVIKSDVERSKATLQAMKGGVGVIIQGGLTADRWFGRPDVLRRVEKPSPAFGTWSYEVVDCKLAQETKSTSVLQLACYSELLGEIQGVTPEFMYVVRPEKGSIKEEKFRVLEYDAYYRHVKLRLLKDCDSEQPQTTYPEPCAHCDVCVWFTECDERRHKDDHLSLVAGITKLQRKQLVDWTFDTVDKLAKMPVPIRLKPEHGSREGLQIVREQARVQVRGKLKGSLVHEFRSIEPETGLFRLPEPSAGDVFLDLEGDPFAGECGQDYLFGFVAADDSGSFQYYRRWALNADEEKQAFEWLIDSLFARLTVWPNMHLYHFGHYEKTHLSKLAGQYATRELEVDRFLRGERFIDVHTAFKQAVRASVEEYSLKKIEGVYGFERKVPLQRSKEAMHFIERRLELGWGSDQLSDELREAMEGYNADDCFSVAALRGWLEAARKLKIEQGEGITRPELKDGLPSEKIKDRETRVSSLAAALSQGIPLEPAARSDAQTAQWLLAQLLGWHRREERRCWQEGFRMAQLDEEELFDERVGISGMQFAERISLAKGIAIERYKFAPQKTNIRDGVDVYVGKDRFGEVIAIDRTGGFIEIKKTKKTVDIRPTSIYMWSAPIPTDAQEESLFRFGEWVLENTLISGKRYDAMCDLLLKNRPRLKSGSVKPLTGETTVETAKRITSNLAETLFGIQGPPGAGKTYTGARMICELLATGKRVGISAHSHKAISKLLQDVREAADECNLKLKCVRKVGDDDAETIAGVENTDDPNLPLTTLRSGLAHLAAGTTWLWSKANYADSVDALFVDEAGQMALADVLAIGPAAKNLVLIGDPQQLQRPLKGSHPPGAEKSALEHFIGASKTIDPEKGMLLPQTRRMHPSVCDFTSKTFYDAKLTSHPVTYPYLLKGHPWLEGAGLWFVPTPHEGNRNSAPEEVLAVEKLVNSLVQPGVSWFSSATRGRPMRLEDILIVAPYKAQVAELQEALPGAKVGTVDKFQGQEAPVVIYSLTTSTPEDAPRGMEFLYSLNRFNVATSRAQTAVIVVGNPRLFEPECKSPRQMQLANAFCAYLERATIKELS